MLRAMRRVVRLPLESGVSALNNLALGVVMVPLGLAVCGAVVAVAVWATDVNQVFLYVFLVGLVIVLGGAGRVRRAWKERPADILLDEAAMTIEGGERHGLSIAWTRVAPERSRVVKVFEEEGAEDAKTGKKKKGELVGRALEVGEGKSTIWRLAMAEDPGEIVSLHELARIIAARAPSVGAPEPAPQTLVPSVLGCPSCGANVAPTRDAEVTCAHCGATVPIPDDVRARVEAALTLPREAQRADRIVERLLDQPGARSTSLTMSLSLAVIGSAWPLALGLGLHAWHAERLDVLPGIALAVLPFLLVADGFFLSRLRLVDRRALAALTLGFGARAPVRPGEPSTCRGCGAPLRDAPEVVVRCVFCGAANLTGLDLRESAAEVSKHVSSLDDALAARAKERSYWRWRTLASVPLFVATVALVQELW